MDSDILSYFHIQNFYCSNVHMRTLGQLCSENIIYFAINTDATYAPISKWNYWSSSTGEVAVTHWEEEREREISLAGFWSANVWVFSSGIHSYIFAVNTRGGHRNTQTSVAVSPVWVRNEMVVVRAAGANVMRHMLHAFVML